MIHEGISHEDRGEPSEPNQTKSQMRTSEVEIGVFGVVLCHIVLQNIQTL